jgi:hypothetical protein
MNHLDTGAVLPFGLLQVDQSAFSRGFNRTYKNTALRLGIVMNSYPVGNEKNVSKLTTEYDVIVNEQNESDGSAAITYRNCLTTDSLGSIADFFERTLRPQTKDSITGNVANTKGQDGAIVLLLCLDGMSEKGVIIGGINHPDRKTSIAGIGPHLEGEFNGIHVVINEDGSTGLTFKGATGNDGTPTDSTQGDTTIAIEKDGSFQIMHKGVTFRMEKGGVVSLSAQDAINITTQKSLNVTAQEDISLTATKTMNFTAKDLVAQLSGSASLECQVGKINSSGEFGIKASTLIAEAESIAKIKAPVIIIDGQVALGGQGGLPVLTLGTTFFGTGNLGIPVLSKAIAGFASKVTAK